MNFVSAGECLSRTGRRAVVMPKSSSEIAMTESSSSNPLAKQYEPAEAQARWFSFWEARGYFNAARDEGSRDEHPSVVLNDLESRRRPRAHIVTFANEKGGVGKSTFAFHCAVALAHGAMKVLVVDCDRRQQSLYRFLEARDGTARALKVPLPRPNHVVLDKIGRAHV